MLKVLDIKEFSYFLRVHRNSIIDDWLQVNEVKEIFNKTSLPLIDKTLTIFYEFCDCFISFIQYDVNIEQCQVRVDLLRMFNKYNISSTDLFILILKLKSSIEQTIFDEGYLAYSFQKELETFSIKLSQELIENYTQLQNNPTGHVSEQSNLLSEYKKAVDLSNIVSKTNPKGIITYVNDRFCDISGYDRGELLGKPHNIIRHPDMPKEAFKNLWDTIKSKKPWSGIVKNMKKNGLQYIVDTTIIPILDVDGDVIEYIAVRHDITELEETKEQLKRINTIMKNKVDELHDVTNSLEEQATRDKLTGIFNRDKFEELLDIQIKHAFARELDLSLIIFDIDFFKNINDTFGHQAGDNVLRELSLLISKNLKTSDIFARWGGEEFVILLPNTSLDGAYQFAQNLRKLIHINSFDSIESLTASFGVGQLDEYENSLTLFEKVDKALYMAKNQGRNRVEKATIACIN